MGPKLCELQNMILSALLEFYIADDQRSYRAKYISKISVVDI